MSGSPGQPTVRYPDDDADWVDEDDDMDYQPADSGLDDEELGGGEFHDAEDQLSGVEVALEIRGDDAAGRHDEAAAAVRQPLYITQNQILRLFGRRPLGRMASRPTGPARTGSDDAHDSDEEGGLRFLRRASRTTRRAPVPLETVPSDTGRDLMHSGTFGVCDRPEDTRARRTTLAYRLMTRELGLGSPGRQRSAGKLAAQGLIPSSAADLIIHYDKRCYSGQFSADGNFFFSCAQDFRVRMYDTSNPYDWTYYRTVDCPHGSWTITDASLSPDNRFLASSSICSTVYLAHTDPAHDVEPTTLEFSSGRQSARILGYHNFGIWSIRFSGDGREIVAGTSDNSVYVYDLERRQTVLQIPGHADDVNAVCYADTASPHILYSGSDDTTLKVWDRRSMGDHRPAGVFLGHTEGLTYVDSKGDGRYVLSNAKDQTAKLWDLRRTMPPDRAERLDLGRFTTHFEYRSGRYDLADWRPHPHDGSLVTFRGHSVHKTLIRCHFSPPGSTDSRYVYSGSQDGRVYVWNLDATLAGTIDVLGATKDSRPRDAELIDLNRFGYSFMGDAEAPWQTCVRDASWHPSAPVVAATAWNGWGTSFGTCTVHTWNDGVPDDDGTPTMGRRVGPTLNHDESLYSSPASPRPRAGRSRLSGARLRLARMRGGDDSE